MTPSAPGPTLAGTGPAPADAAWVTIESPLPMETLREFCRDVERLYRINPCLEISAWHPIADDAFRAAWRNTSNQQDTALDLRVVRESADAFEVAYSQGLRRSTRFALTPAAAGSRLTITDDYSGVPEEERAHRVAEVDPTLVAWGWALHAYLRREWRWGRNAVYRWYMRRIWLPMKPSARRITTLLVLVTAAEFLIVLLVGLIWWIEHR
jgi:hypothetical protein